MNIAYFDCTSGAAGDMILAALVDAGMPINKLRDTIKRLGLSCSLKKRRYTEGLLLQVNIDDELHSRKYNDIARCIERAKLSSDIKDTALLILKNIAVAESRIHRHPLHKVHFHELGTADAIIDIVGTAAGIVYFAPDEIYSSPLPLTHGSVVTKHGRLPIPAPATLELIKGIPIVHTQIEGELITPTGAGIITTLACGFGENPLSTIKLAGTGKGTKNTPPLSNCLRFYLGEGFKVYIVETTIDDMNPQLFGYVRNKLMDAGCVEVSVIPVQGKKDRPTFILQAQTPFDKRNAAINILMKETTTLGVRYYPVERVILERKFVTKTLYKNNIRIKLGLDRNGNILKAIPEYEDCVKLAKKTGKPLISIYKELQKITTI